ncbi:MAG: hypothetical protein Q8Q32_03270 [bacterium]|nr:hypothetical protein [bacterium]
MTLNESQIEEAKAKLAETRAMLEGEIEKLEGPVDLGPGDEGYDEDTEADEAEELSTNRGAAHELRGRHEAVVTALSKIDRGVYGKCEEGSEDIEWEVLSVNPEAKYCKAHIKEA